MKPVRLNRRLALEGLVRVADGLGGFADNWQGLGMLWAEVLPRTGREVSADQRLASAMGYRITVRAAPVGAPSRPRPDQRFREGARVFRILAVAERDAVGRYLTCFAEEEEPA